MVKSPTHRSGHILDVTITECNSPLVSSVHIGHQFLDLKFIHAVLSTTKPVPVETTVKYWKIKNINIDNLAVMSGTTAQIRTKKGHLKNC